MARWESQRRESWQDREDVQFAAFIVSVFVLFLLVLLAG